MDESERKKRARKRRSKGRKLSGIFSCTRKTGSVMSSSSEEEDTRPVKMKPDSNQNKEAKQETADPDAAAIDAKMQEINITLSWIASRKVSRNFIRLCR